MPFSHARKKTMPVESTAPTKAASGTIADCSGKSSIITIANRPAPALTPMIPGSASGLCSTPCRLQPARARLAPTSTVTIVRGRRMRFTMRSVSASASPSSAAHVSLTERLTVPLPMLTKMPATSRMHKPKNTAMRNFSFVFASLLITWPLHRYILS